MTDDETAMSHGVFTPADLARFIAEHGIAAELIPMRVATPTVPAAAAALGVEVGQIIKSLLFLVRDAPVLAIASPVLVIASGETRVERGNGYQRING